MVTYTIKGDTVVFNAFTVSLGDTDPKNRLAVLLLASAAIDEARNAEAKTDEVLDAEVAEKQAWAEKLKAARAKEVDDDGNVVPVEVVDKLG